MTKTSSEPGRYKGLKTITTLFVHNISEKLHWKGLWAAFGHHGEVLDAFIPKKRSRKGKRFGFVRYATKTDAGRAISRLHGFILFGSRISVTYSRFKQRTTFWKKVNNSISLGGHESKRVRYARTPKTLEKKGDYNMEEKGDIRAEFE
ncbi:hypothetical protein V6N13_030876 [Hibiscus sabdariffa]